MADQTYTVVGLGELLWDLFPEGKQLGGAPANFAYMTNLLGDTGVVASRVGTDDLGREARQCLESLGLQITYVQTDAAHATGTVRVEVDPRGQPSFNIARGVAWDYFEWIPAWQSLAEKADAVCFGTLAQRSSSSRDTIRAFLHALRPEAVRIFDVNLRQTFYSAEIVSETAKFADIIKVNHEELPVVAKLLELPFIYDDTRAAQWLREKFGTKLVCMTRGARGSLLVGEGEVSEHAGYRVHVADTVGSGDAFTAALVYHYLRHSSLSTMNEAANRMGAWIASETGATPNPDEFRLERVRSAVGQEEL
jgi:fructokinase